MWPVVESSKLVAEAEEGEEQLYPSRRSCVLVQFLVTELSRTEAGWLINGVGRTAREQGALPGGQLVQFSAAERGTNDVTQNTSSSVRSIFGGARSSEH
jgi:hypothetical protein